MTSSHTLVAGAPSASEEGVDDMKPSSYSLIWFVLMRAIVMVGLVFYCKLIDRRHAAEAQEAILAYRAATQAQIRGLSGREATAEDETEECSICLTAFGKGGDMAVLPCAHAFHRECISCWLLRAAESGTAMTCPLCKAPPFPNAMPLAASTLSHEQQRPNDETTLSPEALEAGSMAAPPPRGITTLAMV